MVSGERVRPSRPRPKEIIASSSVWLRFNLPTIGLFVLAFGGYVKGTSLLAGLPFDITLVAAAGVLLASIHRVLTPGRRYRAYAVTMIVLLLAAMMLGLMKAPLNSYGAAKQFDVLVVLPACLLGGVILLDTRRSQRVWLVASVIIGPLVIITALLDPSPLSDDLWPVGGSTIGVGRLSGAALVVVWSALLCHGRTVASLTLLPVLVGGLVLSGSRGPLAAALLAMAAMSFTSAARSRRAALWGVTAVAAALIGGLALGASAPERLTSFSDASASLRFRLWELAFSLSLEHPLLGIGWGNLYAYEQGNERLETGFVQYPHNVALEVASEAGLIAFVAFAATVLVAIHRQRQAARVDGTELAMYGLLLFYLVNSLASGDIGSNRELWIAIGFAWGAQRNSSAADPLPTPTSAPSPVLTPGRGATSAPGRSTRIRSG